MICYFVMKFLVEPVKGKQINFAYVKSSLLRGRLSAAQKDHVRSLNFSALGTFRIVRDTRGC